MRLEVAQTGIVKSVKYKTDENGNQYTSLDVQSLSDLSIIKDVRNDNPLFSQYVPVVGQIVSVQRVGDYFTRVTGYFGSSTDVDTPINPGEFIMEGNGGSFVYLNNGGDLVAGDETLSNVVRLLNMVGISITGNALSLNISGIGQINITPENADTGSKNQIEIIKFDSNKKPVTKMVMTNDKVSINGPTVEMGTTNENPVNAGIVASTSPIIGTYSYDFMTGRPIPHSGQVSTIFDPSKDMMT